MAFIEPCFGIGHNLSLICQMTSEDIKHQLIIRTGRPGGRGGGGWGEFGRGGGFGGGGRDRVVSMSLGGAPEMFLEEEMVCIIYYLHCIGHLRGRGYTLHGCRWSARAFLQEEMHGVYIYICIASGI